MSRLSFMSETCLDLLFFFPGELIKVHRLPTPMRGIHPLQDCKDRGNEKGSMDLSRMIVPWVPCPTCHGNSQL